MQQFSSTSSGGGVSGFGWLDYTIFVTSLVLSFVVGVYQRFTGDRQRSTGEYLLGNRKMQLFPTVMSMLMSGISAIFVLSSTAEMYMYGTQSWIGQLSSWAALLATAHICVPLIYPLKITSNYEYHDMRFRSTTVRLSNTLLDITSSIMYMAFAMFSPATALEAVTGFPLWVSILGTGLLATIYTTVGGYKAVVWTDFFQGFIFFGGFIAILILGCVKVGGLNEVWEISKEGGRVYFFDMNPDPTQRVTFWTAMLPSIQSITAAASSQSAMQRYMALPTLRDAKMTYVTYLIPSTLITILGNLTGLTVFAYYYKLGCDPVRGGLVSSPNQLLPYFVVDALAVPGLTGLFVAMLFAGALSSISTSMNGMAAITWKDLIEPRVHGLTEGRKTLITKVLACTYGLAGVSLAFSIRHMSGHIGQLTSSILGAISGPTTGVVWLAVFFPWAQWKGTLAGMCSGLFITSWINYGQQMFQPWVEHLPTDTYNCTFAANDTAPPLPENPDGVFGLYRLSYAYISLTGWATTIVVGLIVSFATGPTKPEDLDPKTVVNLVDRSVCNCVPAAHRYKCDYCGYKGIKQKEDDVQEKEDSKEAPKDMEIIRTVSKEIDAREMTAHASDNTDDLVDRNVEDKEPSVVDIMYKGYMDGTVNGAFEHEDIITNTKL